MSSMLVIIQESVLLVLIFQYKLLYFNIHLNCYVLI